ncbi:MAG: hypothetical protein J07HQW2_00067 [Haloquadratum walsbyi J07HQW2]|jgi:hypothetical protein|uniref:Uncharacterized protein n=2 Tax=Haloquadratum walsbyi TaxID=293091 RepID=U1MTM2_9EURY|nr:MAG: hypothetical protein J07HQW2_00067 [Haloquadratum walsbyi J07HQW2]
MLQEAVDALTDPRPTLGAEREMACRGRTTRRDEAGVAVAVSPRGVISGERPEFRLEDDDFPGVDHRVGLIVLGEVTDTKWAPWRDGPRERADGVIPGVPPDSVEIGERDDVAIAKRPYHSGLGVVTSTHMKGEALGACPAEEQVRAVFDVNTSSRAPLAVDSRILFVD